jgi:hypothetical protein
MKGRTTRQFCFFSIITYVPCFNPIEKIEEILHFEPPSVDIISIDIHWKERGKSKGNLAKIDYYQLFATQAHGVWISFPPPPFSLLPPFFQNFHINYSFFKIVIIIRFSSFDKISRRHTSWIIRVFCVHRFSTETLYTVFYFRKIVDRVFCNDLFKKRIINNIFKKKLE